MAINWTTLTGPKSVSGSVANYVNRSDLPINDILTEAEALIYQDLRTDDMLVRTNITLPSGQSSVALPSDYLTLKTFKPLLTDTPMLYVLPDRLAEILDGEGNFIVGMPSMFSVLGKTMRFDVAAERDFFGVLFYYARPAPLSASNETNFLTEKFPSLLRYAMLYFAYEHMKDQALGQEYMAKYAGQLRSARAVDDLNKMGMWFPGI